MIALNKCNQTKTNIMTQSQINRELETTKKMMDKLMACIKEGKKEYYQNYLDLSTYYLKLSKFKPNHNLKSI